MTRRMPSRMALYQSVKPGPDPHRPASLLGGELVAGAPQRVQEPPVALAVDLAPEIADVDVDDIALGVEVQAPDVLRDHGPRQHAAGIAEEVLEQRVLARGEGDAPAAPRDLSGGGVEVEVDELERRRALGGAPAQERADPREELLEGEGLGEVVVGAPRRGPRPCRPRRPAR